MTTLRQIVSVIAFVVVALSMSACATTPPPNPPPPGEATCADACKRMKELSCDAADPTPEGMSCEALCLEISSSELLSWDVECMVRAKSCDAVDACQVVTSEQ